MKVVILFNNIIVMILIIVVDMKKIFYSIVTLFCFTQITAQKLQVDRIEPPNWWANHSYNSIQLLVYGKNLDNVNVTSNSKELIVEDVECLGNTNYAFVNLEFTPQLKPDKYKLTFENSNGSKTVEYNIFERKNYDNKHNGFSNKDVVYLIFPDRFVNGDTTNDFLFNEKEEFKFREENGRHGGDIKGIISKLDYLKDLGITAIWSTPLVENNMYMSYHGYAATDFYKIDPRHGTNELYKEFVNKAHEKGIKVIMDHVANHIGINHKWIGNLPTKTWINGTLKNHLPAEHNKVAYVDVHAGEKSIVNANEGWFVDYMPDLNQRDSKLAKYIIQNTIWWIEYSGIDGIREDTYPYANQKFMSEWANTILEHYPKFNIVGEVWKGDPAILAMFQSNSYFPKEFDSHLPVVTDFAIRDNLIDYMSEKKDINAVYEVLGKDFVYSNSDNLLVFFDNHDTNRGMYEAKGDLFKYKVALTIVLTSRGIPQLFYGSEIGMDGGGHHDRIRGSFPGGFPDDSKNAFTKEGRDKTQNEIFDFTKKLLSLRNKYEVIRTGKLIQYQPKNNVYVYKKENENKSLLFLINDQKVKANINLSKYSENVYKIKDLLHDYVVNINPSQLLSLDAESINIFEIIESCKEKN